MARVKRSRPWWAKLPTRSKLEHAHVDRRGSLQVIASSRSLGTRFGSVVIISSRKGTQRANHYHHHDSHLCYVVSGAMEYWEKPVTGRGALKKVLVKAGQAVFTPPQVWHAMKFLKDTVFVTVADRHRSQADYERDLVRLNGSLIPSRR